MSDKPKIDPLVMASINLFGVLKALEELVRLDESARALIADKNLILRFNVRNGPQGYIHFNHGNIQVSEGLPKRCDMHLWFNSPAHFNRMIDGKGTPVPLKGVTRIGFLTGPFQQLAERLESYLKPAPEMLKNQEFFTRHSRLLGYVAFFALSQIGNSDPIAKQSAVLIPDGDIQVNAGDNYGLYIRVQGGRLNSQPGFSDQPRCNLWFKDLRSLFEVLSDEKHIYDLIGHGRAGMNGYVPMIDYLSPILGRIPAYLS